MFCQTAETYLYSYVLIYFSKKSVCFFIFQTSDEEGHGGNKTEFDTTLNVVTGL